MSKAALEITGACGSHLRGLQGHGQSGSDKDALSTLWGCTLTGSSTGSEQLGRREGGEGELLRLLCKTVTLQRQGPGLKSLLTS